MVKIGSERLGTALALERVDEILVFLFLFSLS
jgi:hypothetical protein